MAHLQNWLVWSATPKIVTIAWSDSLDTALGQIDTQTDRDGRR